MDQPGKVANPARGQLNRENNISLSPCVPENLISRDGFSRPVPRQPAHLHTQAESGSNELVDAFKFLLNIYSRLLLWMCINMRDKLCADRSHLTQIKRQEVGGSNVIPSVGGLKDYILQS